MERLGEVIATGTRSTIRAFGRDHVAKVPLSSTPDSWIRSEAVYTAAVRANGAPAPRAVEVLEIDDRVVSIYERVDGPSMWDHVSSLPGDAAAMGRLLAELHLAVLRLSPPVALPRQLDRLSCKIRSAAALVDNGLIAALELLSGSAAAPSLCHGDLHPGNVILSLHGPVVIDWFDACGGVGAGDVARSSLLMGGSGRRAGALAHLPNARPESLLALHDAYLETVAAALGLGDEALRRWQRIEAVARLSEGVDPVELLAVWNSA